MLTEHLGGVRGKVFSLIHKRTLGSLVIIVDDNDHVFLIRNSYSPGEWRLPGGGLRRRESFRAAAVREAREEVGVHIDDVGSATLQSVHVRLKGGWVDHVAVFVLRGWHRQPVDSWEISATESFPVRRLPTDLAPSHRRRIEEFLGQRPIDDRW